MTMWALVSDKILLLAPWEKLHMSVYYVRFNHWQYEYHVCIFWYAFKVFSVNVNDLQK
jgi:predicted KAP-like P-loop ATPase